MSDLSDFRRFKWRFLSVYFLAQFCEYLQGPYMYALYSEHHGLSLERVGLLFFTSSLSNSLSGCVLGPLTDAYEKSRGCVAFCVCSIISCILTRLHASFWCLLLARILGGTATNLLETSFESFIVYEHHKRDFPHAFLDNIFAYASGGTGLVAVAAGLAASVVTARSAITAPFMLGELVGFMCLLFIWVLWRGNAEGDKAQKDAMPRIKPGHPKEALGSLSSAKEAAQKAMHLFVSRRDAQLCGFLQVGFEVPMDLFVFLWVQGIPEQLDQGVAFAVLMAGVAAGSYAFYILTRTFGIELYRVISISFLFGSLALIWSICTASAIQRFIAYTAFEVVVGLLCPALSSLRAKVLPDACRASATNLPRVALNVGLLGILGSEALRDPASIFACSALAMAVAGSCAAQFGKALFRQGKSSDVSTGDET